MTKENFSYKRTFGSPNLEYETSHLKGLEVIEEKSLFLTLKTSDRVNFSLRIPLNHLEIKENKLISEININDDDNRHLTDIIDSIYANNKVILDEEIGEEGIMHNVSIDELCDYINRISYAELLLIFDDEELLYLDMFEMEFNSETANKENFKNLGTYELYFSISVMDVNKFYSKINCNIN